MEHPEPRPNQSADGIFENLDPSNDLPMPPLESDEQRVYGSLKRIQYWMDDSFALPCCRRRVGLDPVIGLLPFVGDFASAVISLAFVARAAPVLSKYTIVRMLSNVWIDAVVGTVPLLGDVFDIGWKANERNLAIFEDQMKVGGKARRDADLRWILTVVFCFFVFCFLTTLIVITLVVVLILYLTGNL